MTTWAQTWPEQGVEMSIEWSPTTDPLETPSWVSMSNDIRSIRCKRGRSHELDRPQTGNLSAVADNRARTYDSTYDAGPYFGNIVPNRQIRWQMRYNNVVYDVWSGYLDAIDPSYAPGTTDAVVNIGASGILKILSLKRLPNSLFEFAMRSTQPKHWWRMDEADETYFVHDSGSSPSEPGLVTGNMALGAEGFLQTYDEKRTCASFVDGEVVLPNGLISGDSTFTLHCWFYVDTHPTPGVGTDFLRMVVLGDIAGNAGIQIIMSRETGAAGVIEMWGAGGFVNTYPALYDDATAHLASITGDGATVSFYMDGVFVDDGAQAGVLNDLTSANRFGESTAISPDPYVGKLAEVAYYDECMSADDVSFVYRAGLLGGAGEDTGTRAKRLLDYVGVTNYDVTIPGNSNIGVSNINSNVIASEYLLKLADTEQGTFLEEDDGSIVFGSRQERLTADRSIDVQFWFGDPGTPENSYREINFTLDDTRWYTEARVNREGGVEQYVTAPPAVLARAGGIETYSKSGLLYANDAQSADHGYFVIGRFSEPLLRAKEIKVFPLKHPTVLVPAVLSLKIGDRFKVTRHVPGGGDDIEPELVIEGISHEVNDKHEWTCTIVGSPVEALRFWILDDADNSILDESTRLSY